MLKIVTKTYNEVDYGDLEDLVNKTYRSDNWNDDWSFVADQECGNDSDHSFNVKKEPLDKYDQERLNEFKQNGKEGWMAHNILQDLCNQGLIPEGNLLVSVCW